MKKIKVFQHKKTGEYFSRMLENSDDFNTRTTSELLEDMLFKDQLFELNYKDSLRYNRKKFVYNSYKYGQ